MERISGKLKLGELLLGTEGLALLRTAFSDYAAVRQATVAENRALVTGEDGDGLWSVPLDSEELDLDAGYDLWSQTYDRPLRLSVRWR